jgi:hypothetical protein
MAITYSGRYWSGLLMPPDNDGDQPSVDDDGDQPFVDDDGDQSSPDR